MPRLVSAAVKRALVVAIALSGALAALGYFAARSTSVPLPALADERLPCLSYAPFRRPGETPFAPGIVISPAQIDADLAVIAQLTTCVRTYSVDQGLAEVPRLARQRGLRVLLGLWIGRDATENERELALGLDVIRRDADAIDAVIVGNEVLLRRELPPSALRRYIERVRQATPLPVTYADVWEFWLRHRDLGDAVSFVTVHLLPYWEDQPTPIERAVDHVLRVQGLVGDAFPGKSVLIGETGWPSAGRRRAGAVPSRVNQARFIRELARAAAARGLRYNVVEAFDQPWKRRLEGTVGGHWGVYDTAGRAKFLLRGPVIEDPEWRTGLAAAGFGALVFAAAALLRRPRARVLGAGFAALAGTACGAALCAEFAGLARSSRDAFEWLLGGSATAIAGLASVLAAVGIARWLDGRAPPSPAPAAALVEWFRTNRSRFATGERWLGAARFGLLFGAAVVALVLAFDPRYRDFPLALFAPPIAGFALLRWIANAPSAAPEERLLGAVLAAAVPVIIFREGLENVDALAWSALCLAFAWSTLPGFGPDRPREHQRAEQETDRAGVKRIQEEPRRAEANRGERPGARAGERRERPGADGTDPQRTRSIERHHRGAKRAPPWRSRCATEVHDGYRLDHAVAQGCRGSERRNGSRTSQRGLPHCARHRPSRLPDTPRARTAGDQSPFPLARRAGVGEATMPRRAYRLRSRCVNRMVRTPVLALIYPRPAVFAAVL